MNGDSIRFLISGTDPFMENFNRSFLRIAIPYGLVP